jgi:hypothetical protein
MDRLDVRLQPRLERACASRWLGLGVFICSLLLLGCDILLGVWDHDSGYYFLESMFIARGFRPFIDYRTIYPPLFNLLNAIPVSAGLDRFFLSWFMPLFWSAAIGLLSMIYWMRSLPNLARGTVWLIAAAFPLFCMDFSGNHNTLELGIVLFGILALIAFSDRNPRRILPYLIAGFFVGCAVLVKQVGLLLIVPFALQVRRFKSALALLCGLAVPLVVFLWWLGFDLASIRASSRMLSTYLGSNPSRHNPIFLPLRLLSVLFFDLRRTAAGVVCLATTLGLAALASRHLLRPERRREALWMAAWAVVGVGFFAARGINNYAHYTINCWPAIVAILVAVKRTMAPSKFATVFLRCAYASVVLFVVVLPIPKSLDVSPFFLRWSSTSQLVTFLKPAAQDLRNLIPPGSTVTQLGTEESLLFFLADRVPKNKNWAGYDIQHSIAGDHIVFVDYGQETASERVSQIMDAGYVFRQQWASQYGAITLLSASDDGSTCRAEPE